MWLTRLAINRRVTIAMIILGIMVLGLVGLQRMPWDFFPEVDFPYIFVTVPYPGAAPEEVEEGVVKPLEDQFSIISNVKHLTSTCRENMGSVAIQFEYGTNLDGAASDVRDAVDRAKLSFPSDVESPQLLKLNISAMPVMQMGITGDRDPRDLYRLVNDKLKPALAQIPGVASVSITGGRERESQIRVDHQRLAAVGVSLSDLSGYLAASNLKLPAGSMQEGLREYTVRLMGEFSGLDEIRALRVPTPAGGRVRLDTLAEVLDTTVEATTIARVNGQESVGVAIQKQSNANTVQVCDSARKVLEDLMGTTGHSGVLPPDLEAVIARDQSEQVREAIRDVFEALWLGALLASLIVFLFLHNVRATIIIALAIPTSIVCTFLPIGLGLGFTLNMLVMLGLALSVGILIDDSIVVLENIQRHLNIGEPPAAAAYNGRTEIGAAAVAITMVDVVVFVPVALMGGIVGQIFYPFGITVAVCALFSLLVSFTVTPSLAAWWFRRRERQEGHAAGVIGRSIQRLFDSWERGFSALERAYRRVLRGAILHPYWTVAIAYAILIASLFLVFSRLGGGMAPVTDQGQVSIMVESSPGTRLAHTDKIVQEIERRLADKQKYPEVRNISATVGELSMGGLSGDVGGQYGNIFLELSKRRTRARADQRSDRELAIALRRALADIPGVNLRVNAVGGMGGGGDSPPIEVNLLGSDLTELNSAAQKLRHLMATMEGLVYPDTSSKPGRPEAQVRIDRDRLAQYGLTLAQVAGNLRTAYTGATDTKYREYGDTYDVRVELEEDDKNLVSGVTEAIAGVTRSGQAVRVGDIADVYMTVGPSRIDRIDRQRVVSVTGYNQAEILSTSAAQKQIDGFLEQIDLGDITPRWGMEVEMYRESFGFLYQALFLSVLLVYMLTAGLYNSLLEPFNILLNLPVAIVGAGLGLLLFGMQMTIVSMIGIIMLMGIVGKNSILVVDYTNTLRARGMQRTEALLTAGPHRLRPVLMTSLATIFGMVPTAFAVNEGSEFRAPMAVAVIFGLALSTAVSLLLVPATYAIWDSVAESVTGLGRRLFSRRPTPPSSGGTDGR
ncbi:MAG: efflux RND transporter permease subunit [candidate division WS1 bacterium]|nr:efflux RND transporter permease subunit [candidate division WS1 bacterium]